MKRLFLLLLTMLPLWSVSTQAQQCDSIPEYRETRVDTLRQVEVLADSQLRVNNAIRMTLEREKAARVGALSVSDVLGSKLTDKIMHPFAVKERRREKKHAHDRRALEEYEQLDRVKTFEELLDEAIHQQAIEDGKELSKKK